MKTILCFGDSNSWGFIPAKATRYYYGTRWTGVAAQELGDEYHFIEDCISGRTTVYEDPCVSHRCGASNLGYSLLAHAPIDLVILALGGNDLKFTDSDGSVRGMGRMIDLVQKADAVFDSYSPIFPNGLKILLLGPPRFCEDIAIKRPGHALANSAAESAVLAGKYKKLAEERGIYFFDESECVEPSPADCIHLEPEEHKRLGMKIAEKIKEIFACEQQPTREN